MVLRTFTEKSVFIRFEMLLVFYNFNKNAYFFGFLDANWSTTLRIRKCSF